MPRRPRRSRSHEAVAAHSVGEAPPLPLPAEVGGFDEDPKLNRRREDRAQHRQDFRAWLRKQKASAAPERRNEVHCPGFAMLASSVSVSGADSPPQPARTATLSPQPIRVKSPAPVPAPLRRKPSPSPPAALQRSRSGSTFYGSGSSSVEEEVQLHQRAEDLNRNVSIGDRIEGIRAELEARMGTMRFQKMYRSVASDGTACVPADARQGHRDPSIGLSDDLDEALRGGGHHEHDDFGSLAPLVAKLVACENSYFS